MVIYIDVVEETDYYPVLVKKGGRYKKVESAVLHLETSSGVSSY